MSIQALHQSILANLGEVNSLSRGVSLAATDPSGITKGHPYYLLYETVWENLESYDAEKHANIRYVINDAVERFERAGSPADQEAPLVQVLTRLDTIIRYFMTEGRLLGTPERVKGHITREISPGDHVVRCLFTDISDSLNHK